MKSRTKSTDFFFFNFITGFPSIYYKGLMVIVTSNYLIVNVEVDILVHNLLGNGSGFGEQPIIKMDSKADRSPISVRTLSKKK